MKNRLFLLFALFAYTSVLFGQSRKELTLSEGWKFSRDGKAWTPVRIPHDWAIEGPFDKKWDLQYVAIEQNGEKHATEKSGRSGALPWIGEGIYSLTIPLLHRYGHAELIFDGAMSEPVVFVNGKKAGEWAYGYNTFRVDVTPFLAFGGSDNVVEVRLKNVEESSRWYPGAGLYRPVKLVLANERNIDDWKTFVRTSVLDEEMAVVDVDTRLKGVKAGEMNAVEVSMEDHSGRIIANEHVDIDDDGCAAVKLMVKHPHVWTPETPYLYNVRIRAFYNNKVVDQLCVKTGIRTIAVSASNGFQLNGVTRKIKGVCLHHDLGPLGAAVNKAALVRQIRIMKDMGADAIRTSHNMPSQMQMEVCDSMGMMVMAESFDMWQYPKCKNGYSRFFNDWSERDITNLIEAHRNHPCIVMWSIGNEIPEQSSEKGREMSASLQDLCHRLDPTRPVTQGLDRAEAALKNGMAQLMDVPGFNYRVHKYAKNIEQLPQGFLLGSETASTVSSRGVYKFPVTVSNKAPYSDGQCSSYDTEYCSWSNLPEDDFIAQDDLPYTIGQFVWTGFDYLGEPTPYDEYWPSRSSYFGICDLAGLPKDRYYLYRSVWNTQDHTIHLLPHWSWPNRKGKTTPVYCYTDYPSAELFVNGESQGRILKNKSEKMDRYRLRWNNVKYAPGELKVVVYDENGNQRGEKTILTSGKPAALQLESDKLVLRADGEDLAFVTVSLVDSKGTVCPDADCLLTFDVEGAGMFQAVCNGDATSLESFVEPRMRLFNGKLVVLVRSAKKTGSLRLTVRDEKHGLESSVQMAVE